MPVRGGRRRVIAVAAAALLASASGLGAQEVGGKWNYVGGRAIDKGFDMQHTPADQLPAPVARPGTQLGPGEPIWVQIGKTRVLQLPRPIKRVSIGNPDLAGVVVLGPRTVMINGKELPKDIGTRQITPRLRSDLGQVLTQTLTPEPRLAETTFAVWYTRDESPDMHTVVVADFIDRQVLLDVTVAELDRTKFEQWGIDFRAERSAFIMSFFNGGGVGPSPLQAPSLLPAQVGQTILPLGTDDALPIFGFHAPKEGISGLIEAMERDGLIKILARPRLVAMSGQNALFQVGGEIPIRIATGFATDVEFKPFGTIVNFVPRVSEEGAIILTVTPEVSQPDFNSLVEGIPTFRTRRASTSTRLRNGETFVIGGLRQTALRRTEGGVPYLKDIPALGWVFRNVRYDDEVTELMVVTTPFLVQPLPEGTKLALPTDLRPPPGGRLEHQ